MPDASLRQRLGRWIAGTPHRIARAVRMYGAARGTRTTGGFGNATTTADAELNISLARLRNASRQMVRDSAYARRARDLVVNNVIGPGLGFQAQVMSTRGELRKDINDSIEAAHAEWSQAEHCHTGGVLHFGDLDRAALCEVFEAGEVLIRVHDRAFGGSKVPLALELIEAERIADNLMQPAELAAGNELRMGVECDARYGRPQAVWIRLRSPGDIAILGADVRDGVERVPAGQLYHLKLVTRWPQTRGEPWLCVSVRKLDDMNEYSQLELTAARGSAAYFATITTSDEDPALATDTEPADGNGESQVNVMDIQPMTIQQLGIGEKLDFHAPNRPNSALEGFMRAMLREVAAGTGPSYESLSRDYSQSNYSSSRLALLDDRDLWRFLQQWWIRSFRLPLYKRWLRQAVYAKAVAVPVEEYALNPAKFEAVRFKPRGWSWVDPTKEVAAYKEAILGGLTTLTDVIAQTANGLDIEDFITTRKRELQLLKEAGIEVDTTFVPEAAKPAAAPQPRPQADPEPGEGEGGEDDDEGAAADKSRVLPIRPRTGAAA